MNDVIKVKGDDFLNSIEKEDVKDLLGKYYDKIKRQVKNISSFEANLKNYCEYGDKKNKKYSVNALVVLFHRKFESNSSDWDLHKAVRKSFDKIMNEIEHTFHITDQHSKKKK